MNNKLTVFCDNRDCKNNNDGECDREYISLLYCKEDANYTCNNEVWEPR